jgi:protocatechuate 4,5-dioxygenase alpha subunit
VISEQHRPPRTLVFDGALSTRGYVFNKFGWSLTKPENREDYARNPAAYMRAHHLTEQQVAQVAAQDWPALLEDGASIYVLAKLAILAGGSLVTVGARMRGQTAEEFRAFLASPERLPTAKGGA